MEGAGDGDGEVAGDGDAAEQGAWAEQGDEEGMLSNHSPAREGGGFLTEVPADGWAARGDGNLDELRQSPESRSGESEAPPGAGTAEERMLTEEELRAMANWHMQEEAMGDVLFDDEHWRSGGGGGGWGRGELPAGRKTRMAAGFIKERYSGPDEAYRHYEFVAAMPSQLQKRWESLTAVVAAAPAKQKVRDMISARGMTPGWVRSPDDERTTVFSWGRQTRRNHRKGVQRRRGGGVGARFAACGPQVAPSYFDPASLDMLGLASEPVAKPPGSYELPLIRGQQQRVSHASQGGICASFATDCKLSPLKWQGLAAPTAEGRPRPPLPNLPDIFRHGPLHSQRGRRKRSACP